MREPDFTQAAAFLGALTQTDGWNACVTWQTFCDRQKDRYLSAILNGGLNDCAEELRASNLKGASVSVTIQQTDLGGRTWEHILAPRAVFIDLDTKTARQFVVRPSMTVTTPHGQHAYWLLEPGGQLDEIPDALRQLAAFYGADPKVCDICRVMRVPGFFHNKGVPTMVTLSSVHPTLRYSLSELLDAHPVEKQEEAPRTIRWRTAPTPSLRAFSAWADCRAVEKGGRNHNAFVIAAEGLGRGFEPEDVSEVVRAYCLRAGINNEAHTIMQSALRKHTRQPFTSRTA